MHHAIQSVTWRHIKRPITAFQQNNSTYCKSPDPLPTGVRGWLRKTNEVQGTLSQASIVTEETKRRHSLSMYSILLHTTILRPYQFDSGRNGLQMRSVGQFKNKNDSRALQIREEIFPVTLDNHDFSSILSPLFTIRITQVRPFGS